MISLLESASVSAIFQIPQVAGYRFETAPDLADPATRRKLSPAAVKGFFRIVAAWRVRDEDARQLLGESLPAPSIL